MVLVNYEHQNQTVPKGTLGGSICICQERENKRASIRINKNAKKSDEFSIEQLPFTITIY
jgi:hypothetical protein